MSVLTVSLTILAGLAGAVTAHNHLTVQVMGGEIPNAGTNVTLQCNYIGVLSMAGHDHFSWSGPALNNGGVVREVNEETESRLTIYNVSVADQGNYSCEHRRAETVRVLLQVNVLPYFIEPVNLHQSFMNGTEAFVRCRANQSNPNGSMFWSRDNNSLEPPKFVQTFGLLQIDNFQPEDAGNYTCTLTHHGSNIDCRTILVTMAEPTMGDPPRISSPLDNVELSINDSLSLTCNATGVGVSYQWIKLGNEQTIANGSQLNLPATELQNGDNFLCQASNQYGTAEDVVSVFIKVPPMPKRSNHGLIFTQEGGAAIFTSILDQTRIAINLNYSWTHTPLGGSPVALPEGDRLSRLSLADVTAEDAGVYTVRICNQYGCSIQTFELEVDLIANFTICLSSATDLACREIVEQYSEIVISAETTTFVGQQLCTNCDVNVEVEAVACKDEDTLAVSARLIGQDANRALARMEGRGQWTLFDNQLNACIGDFCESVLTTEPAQMVAPLTIGLAVVIVTILLVLAAAVLAICIYRKKYSRADITQQGSAEKGQVEANPGAAGSSEGTHQENGGLETTQPSPDHEASQQPPAPDSTRRHLDSTSEVPPHPHTSVSSTPPQQRRPNNLPLGHTQAVPSQPHGLAPPSQMQPVPLQQGHGVPIQQRPVVQYISQPSPGAYIRSSSTDQNFTPSQFHSPA